jgi:pimeloyl-ACP methyl ester carboxylesterase
MVGQSRARLNGVELAWEVAGAGEPVLLIHGLGSAGADWKLQVPALASRYRVITYDVRGHGDSGKPEHGYDVSTLAADAAALLRQLGAEPAHVVGLSLGGMIAFQLAVDAPELVRSLTVVNSGPALVGRTPAEKRRLKTRLFLTWALGPRGLARLLAKKLFPKREQAPLREQFLARMAGNDRRAYLAVTRAIMGWTVADRLAEVICPVLVVSGDRDYTPVATKEEYVRRLRDARLVVIPDSGHATPLDRPEELNQCLLEFFGSLAPSVASSAGRAHATRAV